METKEKTISENFQANLNKLLLENHLSMRTLSLDIGKSESYIQKVMDNKISPPFRHSCRHSRIFSYSICRPV